MTIQHLCRCLIPPLAGLLLVAGCGHRRSRQAEIPAVADTTRAADTLSARPESPPPPKPQGRRWRALVLHGAGELRALGDSLGPESLAVLLAVNRIDLKHVREGDTLIAPEPFARLDSLSPFPARLAGAPAKLLLVSNRVQAWAAFEHGDRVRWGPCCTGREAKPTPPGLYHTNWRQRSRHSTVDGAWFLEWYVNLANFEGISFHLFELPGKPSSHSCVRLNLDDAKWIYGWCDTWKLSPDRRHITEHGTPTLVLDTYAYGERRPWRALPENPLACDVPGDSIATAMQRADLLAEPAAADTLAAPFDSTKVR